MKASRIIVFALGSVMIVTGVYCLCNPAMTYLSLGYIVGINMIIDAFGEILVYNDRKREGQSNGWNLVASILSMLFGFLIIGSAALQLVVDIAIVYLAASWLVVLGIIRIIFSLELRKIRKALSAEVVGKHWYLVLLAGLLMIACGIFSFLNPAGLILAIGINFGLNIIISGVNMLTMVL